MPAAWGLPPVVRRILPSVSHVLSLPAASTSLLNRAIWRKGSAAQDCGAFLDASTQGPRDFLLLHRICSYAGGQVGGLHQHTVGVPESTGSSPAIEGFLASSSAAFAALFATGVPGVSRAVDTSEGSLDRDLLGGRLYAALSALPPLQGGGAQASVAQVTGARVVDALSVWEDFGVGGLAEAGRDTSLAWRSRTVHARGRSIVVTAAPPPSRPVARFLHRWWHEHTLRPARRAAAVVTVAYICQEAPGGLETVHTGTWECALEAPPPPRLFELLPALHYFFDPPLALTQAWRLVSWDNMDPDTLASAKGLPLPLPFSTPLLRIAAEVAALNSAQRMRMHVEGAQALAGVWDTEVSTQWCQQLGASLGALEQALEGSQGGRGLLASSSTSSGSGEAGTEGAQEGGKGEGKGEGSAEGSTEGSAEGSSSSSTLKAHFALVKAMFEEAMSASKEMAEVSKVTPWRRRVEEELAAEAQFLANDSGAPAQQQQQPAAPTTPTAEQVQRVLDSSQKSTPLIMWYYIHGGGREKLMGLFGELAVRFIDSRFYLLVGAVGLRALVRKVVEEGERQGCNVNTGEVAAEVEEGEEEEEDSKPVNHREAQPPQPATEPINLGTAFDAELREFLSVITWENNMEHFEEGEEEEGGDRRGRGKRGDRANLSDSYKLVKAREVEAAKRLLAAMEKVHTLAKELK